MSLPRKFIAIYTCDTCDDEYEMYNCYVPWVMLWCDDCNNIRRFYSERVIHQSYDWDYIEED